MELEVSKKIRDAIKAKLVELGCHVDDELPDYIMVLIANRRTTEQMENDLLLFLNDNNKKFVAWLTQVLKKLDQVTATNPPEPKKVTAEAEVSSVSTTTPETVDESTKETKTIKQVKQEKNNKKKEKAVTERKVSDKKKHSNKLKVLENQVVTTAKAVGLKETTMVELELSVGGQPELIPPQPSTANPAKVTMAFGVKRPEPAKTIPSAFFEEPEERKAPMAVLSDYEDEDDDEEKTLEEVMALSGYVMYDDDDNIFGLQGSQESISSSQEDLALEEPEELPESGSESHSQGDELILNTEENEFTDEDELRRLALESQESKRALKNEKPVVRASEYSPVKSGERRALKSSLTTGINDKKVSPKRDQYRNPSRDRELPRSRSKDQLSPSRSHKRHSSERSVRPLKKSSVFDRLNRVASDRKEDSSRRRSRSTSPSRRGLRRGVRSVVGNVVDRTEEYEPTCINVSRKSEIKVTERPKRPKMNNGSMLLKAVAEAARDSLQHDQHMVDKNKVRKRRVEVSKEPTSPKRRYKDSSDVKSVDEALVTPTRRSVKERLGVRGDSGARKSVKERLGVSKNVQVSVEEEPSPYFEEDSFSLLVNVDGGQPGRGVSTRSVTLATASPINRISIPVTEEDDTTDEESSSGSETERTRRSSGENVAHTQNLHQLKSGSIGDSDSEAFEVTVSVDNDDRLPEFPSDDNNEYIIEEIEVDECSRKRSRSSSGNHEKQQSAGPKRLSSSKPAVGTVTEETKALMNVLAPSIVYTPVSTDLRGRITGAPAGIPRLPGKVPSTVPSGQVKCKYLPKCVFKQKCKYWHPPCMFNPCNNGDDCAYRHENLKKRAPCKFFPKCTTVGCKFFHPAPCKFLAFCTRKNCEDYHPGETRVQQQRSNGGTVPAAGALKWVKPASYSQ